ncbi:MAG: IPT/TIG domain-containing protein, partial [Actinomycetota bacterium]
MAFFIATAMALVAATTAPVSAQSAPTVSRVSASSGPLIGGQTVTITGKDFTGTTGVDFGAVAATDFAVMSDKQIVATVPNAAAAGKVLVEVTNATGANTTGAQYEYKAPKITKIEPAYAKKDDDNFITITGEGLLGSAAADVVVKGEAVTKVWSISDKQIVVQLAKHDGSTVTIVDGEGDIVITRNSVATVADDDSKFLFTPGIPTITDIEDSSDATVTGTDGVDVGDTLTIVGTNLYAISEVKFGTSKVTGS